MYVTWFRRREEYQYTFEQMLDAYNTGVDLPTDKYPYPRTHTKDMPDAHISTEHTLNIQANTAALYQKYGDLCDQHMPSLYTHFLIPKRSGGFRQIDAPEPTLLQAQKELVHMMQDTYRMLHHDAAFAYIQKRCAKHAVMRHQKSRWFLKLDIKDFFPSWTREEVDLQLHRLSPIGLVPRMASLDKLLNLCFLNNTLPQGSAASPYLSNLCMVPFDDSLTRKLQDFDGHNFIYTRYADDLLISCAYNFNPDKVIAVVQDLLPANLKLKTEKTRYGSNAGRNWNLGLMLNKDQQITVGHKRKETAKAMLFNLMSTNGEMLLNRQEAQVLLGQLAYIESIEPSFTTALDHKFRERFGCASYKTILNRRIKELT